MKNILPRTLAAFGIGQSSAGSQPARLPHEASMNFDLENVETFLVRIERKLGLGFNPKELTAFTAETTLDDERSMQLAVRFAGKSVQLEYRVFMDGVNAPGVYFFSDSKLLIDEIGEEYGRFIDELGI